MELLSVFKEYNDKKLDGFSEIVYSNLYEKVMNNFYFEFNIKGENYLFSPLYTQLSGASLPALSLFIAENELFLNSLKKYILNSLFVYSALVEENSYYLSSAQSVFIARITHKREHRFEVKFYSHYEDELSLSYKDKIYIGRDFINLRKFERKYLGLKKYFLSLLEQNDKMQERAKHKIRFFDEYEKPYLNEIKYLVKEAFRDSMDRVKLFRETSINHIPAIKLKDVLDNVIYIQNLMIELRDFTSEFESKLRLREETDFVKYLTKFAKDLKDALRYLRKLTFYLHLKISKMEI